MRPSPITSDHRAAILRNNHTFVHWLFPMDDAALDHLLAVSDYARQLHDGEAVLFGYNGDGEYRHKNVDWLSQRLTSYFYIDRIIIGSVCQRQGLGAVFYDDVAAFARAEGYKSLACEVNTVPDNPDSHRFHIAQGFTPIGEDSYGPKQSVRYYVRHL